MKFPNGYGNISKLPGKRRNPYRVRKLVGWTIDPKNSPPHICEANISQRSYFIWRSHISLAEGEFRCTSVLKEIIGSKTKKTTPTAKLVLYKIFVSQLSL